MAGAPERLPAISRVALEHVERAHVAYWLFGAIWPLVSMRSFERVTGNKRDEWLVRTVALMMLSVVATLETMRRSRSDGVSGRAPSDEGSRDPRSEEAAMRVLGATSAGALGGVALIGALVGRISPVYLMDAAVDTTLAVLWTLAPHRRPGARGDGSDDPMG
jgi:hypothetical protein